MGGLFKDGFPPSEHPSFKKSLTVNTVNLSKILLNLTLNGLSPIMPSHVSLWDPEDVLEIGQVSSGVTCVGYARTQRRRCHNPIAVVNRQRAFNILLRMSRMDLSAPGVDDSLLQLARLLICIRNHQNQVQEVVAKWRSRIQRFQTVTAARLEVASESEADTLPDQVALDPEGARREDALRIVRPARSQQPPQAQHAAMSHSREIEMARQDIAVARWDRAEALLDLTIARRDVRIALRDVAMAREETEAAREEIRTLRREVTRGLQATNAAGQQIPAPTAVRGEAETSVRTVEATQPNPALSSTPRPRRDQSERTMASGSIATRVSPARRDDTVRSPSQQRRVPREESKRLRDPEEECSICLQRLSDQGIVRCESGCQQPFHGECINAWLPVRRICPLW